MPDKPPQQGSIKFYDDKDARIAELEARIDAELECSRKLITESIMLLRLRPFIKHWDSCAANTWPKVGEVSRACDCGLDATGYRA